MTAKIRSVLCALLCLVWLRPEVAFGQALEVAPITVDLPPGRLTTTLRVTNRGDQPTTIQIRPFTWTQPNGEERLAATADLLVSPPFSTISAGQSQTVRVVLRHPAGAHEDTYRLIVDQLPPAAAPGSIRVALRISLPVFAASTAPSRLALAWRLVPGDATHAVLAIRNDGTRRARLSDLTVAAGAARATIPHATFYYVLAGSEVRVPVELDGAGMIRRAGTVHITATTDQGRIEADAPVAALP